MLDAQPSIYNLEYNLIFVIDDYGRLGIGDIKEIADIKIVDYLSDNR